jgi:hypothetical protein
MNSWWSRPHEDLNRRLSAEAESRPAGMICDVKASNDEQVELEASAYVMNAVSSSSIGLIADPIATRETLQNGYVDLAAKEVHAL